MTDFTIPHFQHAVEQAKESVGIFASGLKQCFDQEHTVEVGEAAPIPLNTERESLNEPGLLIGIRVGGGGMVVVLPESFPLPDWYREPDESQKSRLGTIGMEWSLALFPEELMAEEFTSFSFEDLNSALDLIEPDDEAQWLPLQVTVEGADAPVTIYLVGPVARPCIDPEMAAVEAHSAARAQEVMEGMTYSDPDGRMSDHERLARMSRVLKLKVNVSVRLAEKRIELNQLVAMAPGSLILFDKACEELLDLYVNNTPYCRGEVVKVGEHFGLKINEVGYHIEREPRII